MTCRLLFTIVRSPRGGDAVSALRLSESDVRRVRRLLLVEGETSECTRWNAAMLGVAELIPCDWMGIGVADATGCLERGVELPSGVSSSLDPQVCDGPLPT